MTKLAKISKNLAPVLAKVTRSAQKLRVDKFTTILLLALATCAIYALEADNTTDPGIYMLDVGQGDAFLIETVDHMQILIDTGVGSKLFTELSEVVPVLDRYIDYVFLSHPDMDHIGGTLELGNRYELGTVYIDDLDFKQTEYTKLLSAQLIAKGQLRTVFAGETINVGCCTVIKVLWPDEDTSLDIDTNDRSLSLLVTMGSLDALFLGDLGSKYENALLDDLKGLDIEILKVSHHGSKNSTSYNFVTGISPRLALISVGADNKYGHPDSRVIDMLLGAGVRVLRTDELGLVYISFQNSTLKIEAEKSLENYSIKL